MFLRELQQHNLSFYNALINKELKEHDLIMFIINDKEQYTFLSQKDIYHLVMYDVRKINNMTIKSVKGNIDCYDIILKNIPYFKLLLEDGHGDLYVDFDPDIFMLIIDSLYIGIKFTLSNILP